MQIFLITDSALKVGVQSQHHLLQWPTYACAYAANGKEALQTAAWQWDWKSMKFAML